MKVEAKLSRLKIKMDETEAGKRLNSAKSWLNQALESIENANGSGNEYQVLGIAIQQSKYAMEALKELADHYHPEAKSAAEAAVEPIVPPVPEVPEPIPGASEEELPPAPDNPSYDVPSEIPERMPKGVGEGDLF